MKKRVWGAFLAIILLVLIAFLLWFVGWLMLQNAPEDKPLESPHPPVTAPQPPPRQQETPPAVHVTPPVAPPATPPLPEEEAALPEEEATEILPEDVEREARPITLPNLQRSVTTMSDDEKRAAIEQSAQDATIAAITSGQDEAMALEAAELARQHARRIFYPPSMAD